MVISRAWHNMDVSTRGREYLQIHSIYLCFQRFAWGGGLSSEAINRWDWGHVDRIGWLQKQKIRKRGIWRKIKEVWKWEWTDPSTSSPRNHCHWSLNWAQRLNAWWSLTVKRSLASRRTQQRWSDFTATARFASLAPANADHLWAFLRFFIERRQHSGWLIANQQHSLIRLKKFKAHVLSWHRPSRDYRGNKGGRLIPRCEKGR